jgi:DsbC/DsbD-like thiol-disulfide interchange protein
LYANPVNHEFLEAGQTTVKIAAKDKPESVKIRYPAGKTIVDKKEKYDIYEGVVKIEATVKRASNDTSPLEISVAIQACDSKVCLQPSTLKLVAK